MDPLTLVAVCTFKDNTTCHVHARDVVKTSAISKQKVFVYCHQLSGRLDEIHYAPEIAQLNGKSKYIN